MSGASRKDIEERQRLHTLVQLQAQEIEALKAEITILSRKGGKHLKLYFKIYRYSRFKSICLHNKRSHFATNSTTNLTATAKRLKSTT